MKKLVILTTLLGMVLLTGCGNKEVKVDETTYVETEIEETVYAETETEEETDEGWTVEEAKEEVEWLIEDLRNNYETWYIFDEPMTKELADEFINLLENLEYDESYKYGFDVEKWCLDAVTMYYEHGYCTLEEAILEYHECVSDLDNNM